MSSFKHVLDKIRVMKARVASNSISPSYLGSILEDMLGYTWWSDSPGNFEVGSLKTDMLEAMELIVRRASAIGPELILGEADIIEAVADNADGTFSVRFSEQWPGYFPAQIEHNVLKGYFQNLTEGLEPGDAAQVIPDATAAVSWMNVVSVDPKSNTAIVTLYPDDAVPDGKNYPPLAGMKAVRFGNSGDSSVPRYAQRQSCIVLSSSDGSIRKLYNVTSPVVPASHMALSIGTIPEFVADLDERLSKTDDGIVADTVVARRFITLDSLGRPVVTVIDRGEWAAGNRYFVGSSPNDNGVYERSMVWHNGCGWLANSDHVAADGMQPAWDSPHWTLAVGDPRLRMSLSSDADTVDADDPQCELWAEVSICNQDVTMDPRIRWDWRRSTIHQGVEDTLSDDVWSSQHRNYGPRLMLVKEDFNYAFGRHPDSCVIMLTATLVAQGVEKVIGSDYYKII